MTRPSILAICTTALVLALAPAPAGWGPDAVTWGSVARAEGARTLPVGPEKPQLRGLPPLPELKRSPVNPQETSNLLFEAEQPIEDFDLDRSLSRQCRAGRFRQQREHLYIVRLGGVIHGAVIGGFWGLYDPQRLALQNVLYVVRGQDTGRCEVRVVRHLKDRPLGGTPGGG